MAKKFHPELVKPEWVTGVVPCCDGLGAWRCERPPDELALTRSHNPASSGRT
ncbi:MAG: hypothetical protein U0270_43120 [Labilithrix sp.]